MVLEISEAWRLGRAGKLIDVMRLSLAIKLTRVHPTGTLAASFGFLV